MTVSEKIGRSRVETLPTELPDVALRLFTAEDLPAVKDLMDSNFKHFAQGGIISDGLYTMIENELDEGNSPNQRFGIWKDGALVGYAGINPSEDSHTYNEVEIAYAIDEKHSGQGIASAAIETLSQIENDKGYNVVAEVESRNIKSMRLLGKLGFEHSKRRNSQGREVFTRHAITVDEMMRRLGF